MSYALDYFRASGLSELVESGKIDTIPVKNIIEIVTQYINNRQEAVKTQYNDRLSIFSDTIIDRQIITNSLFYNRIFVPDPVVADCGKASLLFPSFPVAKSNPSNSLRSAVKNAVYFYNLYAPLINNEIIVPITIPNAVKEIPFLMPQKDFSECIPCHLREILTSSAKVFSCQSSGSDGFVFTMKPESTLTPSNVIMIDILGEQRLYHLSRMKSFRHENGNNFQAALELAGEDTVTEDEFYPWVNQSIFQTMRDVLQQLQKSIQISTTLGCSYQTNRNCEKMILEQSYSSSSKAPVNFFNVNLRDIKMWKPSEIARFREKNKKHFKRFQQTILESTFDLRHLSEEEFKEKAHLKLHNEVYPQVEELRSLWISDTIKGVVSGSATTALGLGIAVATGGSLSVASALAVIAAGATIPLGQKVERYYKAKRQPEFIWYQLLK